MVAANRGMEMDVALVLSIVLFWAGGAESAVSQPTWIRQLWDHVIGITEMDQKPSDESSSQEFDVLWGIPDVVATLGHLFRYQIPYSAFSEKGLSFKVHEASSEDLPSWLYFNASSQTFLGVAAPLDIGATAIEVTARSRDLSHNVSTHFVITVQAEDSTLMGQTLKFNGQIKESPVAAREGLTGCRLDQDIYRATLILDESMEQLSAKARVKLIYKSARFLSQRSHSVTVGPKKSDSIARLLDRTTIAAGPGDIKHASSQVGIELSWIIGCESFPGATDLATVLEHNIQTGRIRQELGYHSKGWLITETKSQEPYRKLSRQRRQVRGTPVPTPTVTTSAPTKTTDASTFSVLPDVSSTTTAVTSEVKNTLTSTPPIQVTPTTTAMIDAVQSTEVLTDPTESYNITTSVHSSETATQVLSSEPMSSTGTTILQPSLSTPLVSPSITSTERLPTTTVLQITTHTTTILEPKTSETVATSARQTMTVSPKQSISSSPDLSASISAEQLIPTSTEQSKELETTVYSSADEQSTMELTTHLVTTSTVSTAKQSVQFTSSTTTLLIEPSSGSVTSIPLTLTTLIGLVSPSPSINTSAPEPTEIATNILQTMQSMPTSLPTLPHANTTTISPSATLTSDVLPTFSDGVVLNTTTQPPFTTTIASTPFPEIVPTSPTVFPRETTSITSDFELEPTTTNLPSDSISLEPSVTEFPNTTMTISATEILTIFPTPGLSQTLIQESPVATTDVGPTGIVKTQEVQPSLESTQPTSLPGTTELLPPTTESLLNVTESLPPATESLPAATESLPPATQSLPAATESLPPATQSLPAATESLPAATESLPPATQSLPAATESLPPATQSLPAATESLPPATQSLPAATESLPPATQSLPAATQSLPLATESLPSATQSLPLATESIPLATQSLPAATELLPPATASLQVATELITVSTMSTPQSIPAVIESTPVITTSPVITAILSNTQLPTESVAAVTTIHTVESPVASLTSSPSLEVQATDIVTPPIEVSRQPPLVSQPLVPTTSIMDLSETIASTTAITKPLEISKSPTTSVINLVTITPSVGQTLDFKPITPYTSIQPDHAVSSTDANTIIQESVSQTTVVPAIVSSTSSPPLPIIQPTNIVVTTSIPPEPITEPTTVVEPSMSSETVRPPTPPSTPVVSTVTPVEGTSPMPQISPSTDIAITTSGSLTETTTTNAPTPTLPSLTSTGIVTVPTTTQPPTTTTTPPNSPPQLIHPVDQIKVQMGVYFEYVIPADTFYDIEDGDTRALRLRLLTLARTRLHPGSWVQFDNERQTVYGIALTKDLPQSRIDEEFLLTAEDSQGLRNSDALIIVIETGSYVNLTHQFVVTFDEEYLPFISQTKSILDLVGNIATFYGDTKPTKMTVTNLTSGSLVVYWSNNTLSREVCENETIQSLYEELSGGGKINPDFRIATFPRYNVLDVGLIYQGACLPKPVEPTLAPPGEPPVLSSSDSSVYYRTVIPAVVIVLLLLIAAIIICICLQRRKRLAGRLLLDDEKPIFARDRHPVLLESDLEMRDVAGRKPHRPLVLTQDGAYANPTFQAPPRRPPAQPPPYRVPRDYGPFFDDDDDFDGAAAGDSPPPEYLSDPAGVYSQPPPAYRLPPPYSSRPGSSDA